jgi:hypothetical protein
MRSLVSSEAAIMGSIAFFDVLISQEPKSGPLLKILICFPVGSRRSSSNICTSAFSYFVRSASKINALKFATDVP